MLPASVSLKKGSFLPHALFSPMIAHHKCTDHSVQAILPSPLGCCSGNAEFNALQQNAATQKKDHFHLEVHITDSFTASLKLRPSHYLRAGSQLQMHALGRLSCGHCSLLMPASYATPLLWRLICAATIGLLLIKQTTDESGA